MGNDDDGVGEVDEELLKPCDRVQIQVVGGLVQKKDIGISEKRPRQQHLDLLRAGQLSHEIAVKFSLDPESVEEGLRVGLRLPAVELRKLGLKFTRLDAVLVREVFLHIKGILLLHDLEETGIALNDSVENDLVVIFILVLLQERKALSGSDRNVAVRGVELSAQDP